jgi:ubiquinone biosynthesis protein
VRHSIDVRVLRWPGNVLRAVLMFVFVALVLVGYGLGRLIVACAWGRERRRRWLARWRGKCLRFSMTTLGATFIKMGQVMSTRPDLFSGEVIDELKILQDRLPPFGYGRVRRIVEQDLGAPIAARFAEFDRFPVAAASVAQVHRARLSDGTVVAVKVLRPSIRRRVQRDAAILTAGARLLHIHPQWRLSDPVGHVRHFVAAIIDQTDLRIECQNYRRFHANFAGAAGIRFPKVYEELSSERVLTMEFVRGVKLDKLPRANYPVLAKRVRYLMFKMCFDDGFLHADLHPGNMLVVGDNELCVLDVGLAKLLPDEVLSQFIDMSKCISMGTPDDLVAHLKRFHTYLAGVDWDVLRQEVEAFGQKFRAQGVKDLEYGELLSGILAIGRRHRVHPVTEMALVFVAIVTAQGISKQLNPDADIWPELARFLIPILIRRGEPIPISPEAAAAQAAR